MAKPQWIRPLTGFLVAPILPGVLLVLIVAMINARTFDYRELVETEWILGLFAVLTYPVSVVVGLPLYLLFRSRGWNGLLLHVAAGVLLGVIVYVTYYLLPNYTSGGFLLMEDAFLNTVLIYLPLGMIYGAITALLFWLITRPDRRTPE